MYLLRSLLRSKKRDITPSDTRISTITIATTAPALLALVFLLSLLPPPLLPVLPPPLLLVPVGDVGPAEGGLSVSSLVLIEYETSVD